MFVILAVLITFKIQKPLEIYSETFQAFEKCKKICENAKEKIDLSNGPCLANPIEGLENWVCDIAHNPRIEIDNLPENQCSAFREGKAKYFVELDPNCNLIKIYYKGTFIYSLK